MTDKNWIAVWKTNTGLVAMAKNPNKELAKEEAKRYLDNYIAQCKANGGNASVRDFQLKVYKEK